MSKFLTAKYKNLVPYTPGEQPKDKTYVKLNTNESPFPPSEKALEYGREELGKLNLYPDPACDALACAMSKYYGIDKECIIFGNGSDEILNFAFMAFCDDNINAVFPDITYSFYKVFADLNKISYTEIPLEDDFTIDINKYIGINKTVFIANPNAPTGILLSLDEIETIVKSNSNNIVVIDEAYVDFGGKSAVELTKRYDNLLVVQTFSKSRSMAGARLGVGIGSKELIRDLNTIKYSINPYNVNKVTMAMGIGSLKDDLYTKNNCNEIVKNREYTQNELLKLGFVMTDSYANFLFAKHNKISGEELYLKLKEKNVLVRHFGQSRIKEYNRITVGTLDEMKILVNALKEILEVK